MKLVVDVNIVISALIKHGKNTDLLFHKELCLFTPQFFVEEFAKHEKLILNKTSMSRNDFNKILKALMSTITIIPKDKYNESMRRASIISSDPNDITYFALALTLNCPIWTNDKEFKKQNIVKIYSTEDLLKIID